MYKIHLVIFGHAHVYQWIFFGIFLYICLILAKTCIKSASSLHSG